MKIKNLANDVTSWECEKRHRGECKAKIKLDEAGNFLERINYHTHAPSETKCEIAKVRANIKRRATETQDPAQVILGIELGGISEAAAINLPALHHIRRNIRLQRQVNQQLPRGNFSRGTSLVATKSHALHTIWNGLITNHSVD